MAQINQLVTVVAVVVALVLLLEQLVAKLLKELPPVKNLVQLVMATIIVNKKLLSDFGRKAFFWQFRKKIISRSLTETSYASQACSTLCKTKGTIQF